MKRVWAEVLRAINLEKSLSGWEPYRNLTKSHEDLDITTFFGEVLRWLAIVVFLIPASAALGIVGADEVLENLLGFLPNVFLASLFLLIGFVISWFAHRLVMAIGVLIDRNPAHLIADFTAAVIIIFAFLQALLQLGLGMDIIRFLVLALLAAAALSLGLAGKDSLEPVIKKFIDRASK